MSSLQRYVDRFADWLYHRQERYVKKCEVDVDDARDRLRKFQRYVQLGGMKIGPKRIYEQEQEVLRCEKKLEKARDGLTKLDLAKKGRAT